MVLPEQCLHRRRRSWEHWLLLLTFTPLSRVPWLRPSTVATISRKPSPVCCSEDPGSGEDVDCIPCTNDEQCPPRIKCNACKKYGPSRLPDGLTRRGDINLLMLGDPGTAKSQLLKFVERCSPIGVGIWWNVLGFFFSIHLKYSLAYDYICAISGLHLREGQQCSWSDGLCAKGSHHPWIHHGGWRDGTGWRRRRVHWRVR